MESNLQLWRGLTPLTARILGDDCPLPNKVPAIRANTVSGSTRVQYPARALMTVVSPIRWRIARRAGQPVSRVPHGRRTSSETHSTRPASRDLRSNFPSTGTILPASSAYNTACHFWVPGASSGRREAGPTQLATEQSEAIRSSVFRASRKLASHRNSRFAACTS